MGLTWSKAGKILLKDVVSLAAVFWMSRQAPPNVTSKKKGARETMKDGDGRKAATLWGQSDFGSFCAGPQIKDNGKVARFGLRTLHR